MRGPSEGLIGGPGRGDGVMSDAPALGAARCQCGALEAHCSGCFGTTDFPPPAVEVYAECAMAD